VSEDSGGPADGWTERAARRLIQAGGLERVAIGFASTTLAILIGLILVTASGHSPIVFLVEMLDGIVGSKRGIALTLRESTIFILSGVAVAVAFRAGVFNIGVHGQLVFGGLAAVMTVLYLAPYLPENVVGGGILVVLGMISGVVVGGLYAAFPGVLKAYADANEIITTIMLNFIALGVGLYLLTGPFQGEGIQEARTDSLPDHAGFPELVFSTGSFSLVGLAIALATVAGTYVLLTRTHVGYDMVTSGQQEPAARYSGVPARRTIVGTMTLSGMIAGLAGAVFGIMVLKGFVNPEGIKTYGFDAIAVSLLAANNPLGVVPAGVLFGGLARGGSFIGVTTDIPSQLVDGVVGLVVLFVAAPELFRMAAKRWYDEGER
jgi:simple sugar transport system permease protein